MYKEKADKVRKRYDRKGLINESVSIETEVIKIIRLNISFWA